MFTPIFAVIFYPKKGTNFDNRRKSPNIQLLPTCTQIKMFKLKILFFFILCFSVTASNAQFELSNPMTANSKNIKAGALIIAMDTINQKNVSGYYNLKSYGLVNEILQNEIPVMWIIKNSKSKNAADFTASATRVFPDTGSSVSTPFYSGPFVIDTPYVAAALPIIKAYGNGVKVFRLEVNTNMNVRYNLTHKPKVLLLNTGGYDTITVKVFQEAGFNPNSYYMNPAPGAILDPTAPYTMISETHVDVLDSVRASKIRQYVETYGGNFVANCVSLGRFENKMYALTTGGVDSAAAFTSPGSFLYPVTDQGISQFHGILSVPHGEYKIWKPKPSSTFRSTAYQVVNNATWNVVTAGKLKPNAEKGGNLLYLAGHDWFFWTVNGYYENAKINGRRIFLNSAFLPASDSIMAGDFRTDLKTLIVPQPGFAVKTESYKILVIVKNYGPGRAKNVTVNAPITTGLTLGTYTTTSGTYNSGTGVWTLDSLTRSETDTLVLNTVINKLGNISFAASAKSVSLEFDLSNNNDHIDLFGVSRPTVENDTMIFPFATYVDVPTKQNDSDEDLNPFGNSSIVVNPQHGVATIINSDSIRYTLASGFSGIDSIRYVSCDNLPLCDTAWIYIIIPTPLPISLLSFEGIRTKGHVDLKWITLTEKENDYFTVQKSINGIEFKDVAKIQGAGTINVPQYYSYRDIDNNEPVLYYRLRQTDYDGTYTLSHIISLRRNNLRDLQMTIYPNPSTGEQMILKINGLMEDATFVISDLLGRPILERNISGDENHSALELITPESKLEAGSYLATLFLEGQKLTTRIIIR